MLRRLPISVRHAFALAFDLAVRRDPVQSLLVPALLQAPWFLALALLHAPEPDDPHALRTMLLYALALVGQWFTWLLISAMLRFRARSVYDTPAEVHPAPIGECYALGLRRAPWLFVTEFLRNLSFGMASGFLILPFLYLGFKFSLATEAVVLEEANAFEAFKHSFRMTEGRFERWLEQLVVSVVLGLSVWFLMALMYVAAPGPGVEVYSKVGLLIAVVLLLPIIQYAWTFFYLRLVETERPIEVVEGEPSDGQGSEGEDWQPRLRLVDAESEGNHEGR